MDEEMYSLPYKEALAEHRKKYGNNVPFISKDQYELKQAQIEKQKKMAASEGEAGWWTQEGPSDETIAKYGNTTAKDIAERRITPEQQGIQAKGNPGDNINNPNALDSTEIDKLHKAEKAMVQTEDNMEPTTWSMTQEEVEKAKQNAGIADATVTDSVSEAVAHKESDTPKESKAKGKYNKSMMSIWDAYRNGDIDKETAGYFTIDAIATLAKNLGRSIGNVGAQFSGGTIDNGHDTSMWEQRRDSMFNTELQKESEEVKTFDNLLKGYQTNRAATVNDMLNDFRARANDPKLSETEKKFYQVLSVQLAGAGLDGNTQIASIGTGVWDDIKSKFGEWFGNKDKEGK